LSKKFFEYGHLMNEKKNNIFVHFTLKYIKKPHTRYTYDYETLYLLLIVTVFNTLYICIKVCYMQWKKLHSKYYITVTT